MRVILFILIAQLFITQSPQAQNPLLIKNVGGTVLNPENKDQNEWQSNLWNGKRFYQGTGTPFKLCVTDGTTAGTVLVSDLGTVESSIINFIPAKDFIYIATNRFVNNFSQIVWELWKSDGTAAGTSLVKSFDPHGFSTSGSNFTSDALNVFNYSVDGNIMYFAGYSTANGQEPWRTDGTTAGTYMVKDIKPGTCPSYAGGFCKIGSTTLFRAASVGFGTTLWKTDGTEAGTVDLAVPGLTLDYPVARINNKMIFYGNGSASDYDMEPWVTDGTVAGTFRLADINPGPGKSTPTAIQNLHLRFNDKYAFFIAQSGNNVKNLWRTDGTVAGTIQLTQDGLINEENYGGGGYSVIDNNGLWWIGANQRLYFSDGTVEGTRLVTGTLSNAQYMCLYKGAAWFHARNADRVSNAEPYRSDGTAANTNLALEVGPGQLGSGPYGFFELNNKLYFFTDGRYAPAKSNLYQYTGDYTFNGSLPGTRWQDSANWNSMMPPGITDTAYINSGITVNVNAGNAYAGILMMQNGSVINISAATDSIFIHSNLFGTSATGNGAVVIRNFNGDTATISNAFNVNNLHVNGVASLLGNLSVNVNLNLTNNARLIANNSNINLTGSISSISNSANNYVVTNGLGKLIVENIGTGGRTGNVVFPIGTSSNYNPVTISNAGTMDAFAARTQPGLQNNYTGETPSGNSYTTGVVNNTWFISEANAGGSLATIGLQWNASQELPGFDRTLSQLGHYTNGSWMLNSPTPAIGSDPYNVAGTAITSFSPFGVFNSNATLPIQNIGISAIRVGNNNRITWNIVAADIQELIIEKSADGRNFTKLLSKSFTASGTTDDATITSKTYYRFHLKTLDGRSVYSSIVWVAAKGAIVQVYPTLVTGRFTVNQAVADKAALVLTDVSGKVVLLQTLPAGFTDIDISSLSKGSYFYQLRRADGSAFAKGLIIRQ